MLIWTHFSYFGMWNSYLKFVRIFQLHPVYTYVELSSQMGESLV
jgi:hypothetical protein